MKVFTLMAILSLTGGLPIAQGGGFDISPFGEAKSEASSPFALKESAKTLHITEAGKPVLDYNFGMMLKEGAPEDRRRACYIHPIYSLDGTALTDDFPRDHYHHRGLAWMWPVVYAGDRKVDEWTIRGCRQHFVRWLGRETTRGDARIGVQADWIIEDASGNQTNTIAHEYGWYRIHKATKTGRAVDVHYTLQATDQTLRISGTSAVNKGSGVVKGYGGFSLRFIARTDTVLTTPAGRITKETDRVPQPWADLSGVFTDAKDHAGIAIFTHPSNPGYPNGWTLRPADHFGFYGVAWPGIETVTLEPGEAFTLQYRVWIHRGGMEEGKVVEEWEKYEKEVTSNE